MDMGGRSNTFNVGPRQLLFQPLENSPTFKIQQTRISSIEKKYGFCRKRRVVKINIWPSIGQVDGGFNYLFFWFLTPNTLLKLIPIAHLDFTKVGREGGFRKEGGMMAGIRTQSMSYEDV